MDQKYNGWTNYETWRIGLEIFDGYEMNCIDSADSQEEALEMVEPENLKDYAQDILISDGKNEHSLTISYALSFIADANYHEISEHLKDNIKEHFDERESERQILNYLGRLNNE